MGDVPLLSDGVIDLAVFGLDDVADHVNGEDEESLRWLTGGLRSTVETTTAWVQQNLDSWGGGGPRRLFAIRGTAGGRSAGGNLVGGNLVGMVEVHLDHALCGLPPGEANISYQVYPAARRQGYAVRAVQLACSFLRGLEGPVDGPVTAVLRIHPDNVSSLGVAVRAGFHDCGWTITPDGDRLRYFRRRLRPPPESA